MALYQVSAGDRILAADLNQFYNILKGVAASGEAVTLIYNAAGSLVIQPSSDPAAGTEAIQIKNNAGTVQSALSFDGRLYPADGLVGTPGIAYELDKDTGLYRIGANSSALVAGGTERLRWDGTGMSLDGGTSYLQPGAWTASAALTLTQGVSPTFTQTSARYAVFGKTAFVQILLSITSAGTGGSAIVLGGIPAAVAPKLTGAGRICGNYLYFRTGVTYWQGAVEATTASTMNFFTANNAGALGVVPNFATANGDTLALNLSYEIA